ncbi:MAG: hypothetical protein QM773_06765 [Hyphomonadaceae bacterium]
MKYWLSTLVVLLVGCLVVALDVAAGPRPAVTLLVGAVAMAFAGMVWRAFR